MNLALKVKGTRSYHTNCTDIILLSVPTRLNSSFLFFQQNQICSSIWGLEICHTVFVCITGLNFHLDLVLAHWHGHVELFWIQATLGTIRNGVCYTVHSLREPGVGPQDPCWSHPTWDTLGFCDQIQCFFVVWCQFIGLMGYTRISVLFVKRKPK